MKRPTSFRLSEDAINLLKGLAKVRGLNQTAVLEMLIRMEAKDAGVVLPSREGSERPEGHS